MSDVDEITKVLDQHIQIERNRRCICGWRGDVSKSVIDPNNIYQQHRNHVAEAIVNAGFKRASK